MLRSIIVKKVSAWMAHALAWAPGAFLAFGPVYQGVSVAPASPGGEPSKEVTRSSATLVEANGPHVIALLLVPVLLTGIALLSFRLNRKSQTAHKVLLWGPAIMLLGFCIVAIWSIGMFYLPAAFALLVAAYIDCTEQKARS